MKNKRILIVDDHKEIVELTQTILNKRGFTTFALFDGIGVIECIVKNKPDIILLDNLLPSTNGREICNDIKSNEQTKGIPVVLASGALHLSENDNGKILLPPDYELQKPYDMDALLEIIARIFEPR